MGPLPCEALIAREVWSAVALQPPAYLYISVFLNLGLLLTSGNGPDSMTVIVVAWPGVLAASCSIVHNLPAHCPPTRGPRDHPSYCIIPSFANSHHLSRLHLRLFHFICKLMVHLYGSTTRTVAVAAHAQLQHSLIKSTQYGVVWNASCSEAINMLDRFLSSERCL